MTFYVITTGFSANTLERAALLRAACSERGVHCLVVESTTIDRLTLPNLQVGDALYNASRDGMRLEESLWRPGVATFYTNDMPPRGVQDTTRWIADHTRADLPQPRTISHQTADRELLARYVEELGGFPLVVKIANSTLGNGVIRTDSWPALLSLIDYLAVQGTDFILRQYIEGSGSCRLMVIGNRVVGSLEYDNPTNDFRTNAGCESQPRLAQFSSNVEALAVAAVRAVGVELGGVDVMCSDDGLIYLLEMNIPCGFATFSKLGVDVPGMIVEHLKEKSERFRNG